MAIMSSVFYQPLPLLFSAFLCFFLLFSVFKKENSTMS